MFILCILPAMRRQLETTPRLSVSGIFSPVVLKHWQITLCFRTDIQNNQSYLGDTPSYNYVMLDTDFLVTSVSERVAGARLNIYCSCCLFWPTIYCLHLKDRTDRASWPKNRLSILALFNHCWNLTSITL